MSILLEISSLKKKLIDLNRKFVFQETGVELGQGDPIDIDPTRTILHPDGASIFGEFAAIRLAEFESRSKQKLDAIGGSSFAAVSLSTSTSLRALERGRKWLLFSVRNAPNEIEESKYLDGAAHIPKGAKIAVLEGILSTGESSVRTIERLRADGYNPVVLLTAVDCERGGVDRLGAIRIEVISLLRRSEFVQ